MRAFKTVLAGTLAAASLAVAGSAHAAVYVLTDDHCTGTCGSTNYGTITVTGTTTLNVVVDLADNVYFNPNGIGLDTIAWSLVGNPLINVTLPALWSVAGNQAAGTNHEDGLGDWDYIINLASGNNTVNGVTYSFTGAGANTGNVLTLDSNSIGGKNIFFSVDILGVNGNTGVIGAVLCTVNCDGGGGGQGGIPEPATWAMMLLGFGGMGALLRRRRSLAALA